MQVSVEQTSELSRKMTVNISEEVIQEKVDARLKSLKSEIKIDGFRPGKTPQSLINKRYGTKVRGEIAGDVIQSSYYEALKQENLTPVDMPHIHPIEQKEGLAYTAEFEIYPTISLDNLSTIEAKRPVSTIEPADFDEMIEKLRSHKTEWISVERASQDKDRLTINFSGICEGENFTDGKVEDFNVEIGSKQMLPGFEDQLLALEVGNNKSFEVTFPESYSAKPELANKPATFEVDITKIEEPQLPEIDEEFIQAYGIESGEIEAFHVDVKANMENELKKALAAGLKHSVLEALYENIAFTMPKTLIDREVETIIKPYLENAKKQNQALDLPRDIFETEAKRRVGLGLILSEIIQVNKIIVDNNKLRDTIKELALSYDSPDEVLQWYYQDEARLNEVKQAVLEEQTVEWLTDQMIITDEPQSFSDSMTSYHQQQQQRG